MTGLNKPSLLSHHHHHHHLSSSYQSLYHNPLTVVADKENAVPVVGTNGCSSFKTEKKPPTIVPTATKTNRSAALKSSSLQLCIRLNEPDPLLADGPTAKPWCPIPSSASSDAWDFSDSEAAPASSWSALPNRSLLCRPLPVDVGRCTCIIAKESSQGPDGDWVSLYSLYTNEGSGRQDRKLAVARHRRRNGRSEFIVAQNPKGIFCCSDESFLGNITANLMGSKYQIKDQGSLMKSTNKQSRRLLGVVAFVPTIATCTGSFRSIRAWIPKHQSMQLKNTNAAQIQHISGLPQDWVEKRNRTHQLFSKIPCYNTISKRYELDFRERAGRTGTKIRPSLKNFQLTIGESGREVILQLGRIAKSKYVMDYRHPLTGYQAFCICLASIDSKLCCTV